MSIALGVPARMVAYLKDVKPTVLSAVTTTTTLAEARGLRNRLPMRWSGVLELDLDLDEGDGDREGGGGGGEERVGRFDLATLTPPGGYSDGSSTVQSDGALGREGELRALLLGRQQQEQQQQLLRFRGLRGCEAKVLAWATVLAVLLIAFFFAGVYLGATQVSVFGG
jgi:hypothetical protein